MRNLLIIPLKSSCMWQVASLFCFQDSLLVFTYQKFNYNVSWCGSLWIYLFGVPWASWIFIFMSFIKLEKFSAIISSNILSTPFYLSPLAGNPTVGVFVHLIVSHRSLILCSLFFNLFSFYSSNSIIYIVLSSSLLILLLAQICLWIILMNFKFHSLYFSVPKSLFSFFLGFLSLNWYFHFIDTLFSWLSPHLPLVLWASLRELFFVCFCFVFCFFGCTAQHVGS